MSGEEPGWAGVFGLPGVILLLTSLAAAYLYLNIYVYQSYGLGFVIVGNFILGFILVSISALIDTKVFGWLEE